MAVTEVHEKWEGRDGTFGKVSENGLRRMHLVKTSNKWDDAYIVSQSNDLPKWNNPHPSNFFFRARKQTITPVSDTPFWWEVVTDYTTEPVEDEERQDANPLDRETKVTWASQVYQGYTVEDKDGNAMLNKAGDPLEPLPVDLVRWNITFQKNFTSVPLWVTDYVNCINDSATTINGVNFPKQTLKLQGLDISDKQVQNDVEYYSVKAQIVYQRETFVVRRLNEGFAYLDGGSTRTPFTESDGSRSAEMRCLDEDGDQLANPTAETAVFLEFEIYEEKDFNALPF